MRSGKEKSMGLAKWFIQHMRRRGRFWWLPLLTLALTSCQLCNILGLFSPIYYGSTHSQVAPAGWRNISPRGIDGIADVAMSATSPGLMVACTLQHFPDMWDLSTWPKGGIRFWLSHDGGVTWRQLHPPARQQDWCAVDIDVMDVIIVNPEATPQQSDDVWASGDQGKTWRRGEPQHFALISGDRIAVELVARRGDLLYGTYR
jgi:hypothetical protein